MLMACIYVGKHTQLTDINMQSCVFVAASHAHMMECLFKYSHIAAFLLLAAGVS
jgi:hypothetical protein